MQRHEGVQHGSILRAALPAGHSGRRGFSCRLRPQSGPFLRFRRFPALLRQGARVCLPGNDGRKSCKAVILYIIFNLFIDYFFIFGLFICIKGEKPFAGAGLSQCQLDSVVDHIKNIIFPGKTHFHLCRMDVDIHKVCRHFQQKDAARELALHHGTLEGHLHASHHGAVAHIAAIDVKMLHAPAGAAAFGRGDQAGDAIHTLLIFQLDEVPAELPAQNRIGRAAQLTIAGGDILQLALPDEFDTDLRVAEGHMGNRIRYKGALGRVLFEELHAGGGVVEQVLHPDGSTHRTGTRLPGDLFPALDAVDGGKLVCLGAGGQLHPRHAGNGCQCFAAEAQRVDAVQVIRLFDLAGGMADKRRGNVFRLNAGAVVADFDQLDAAGFNADRHLRSSGINGVFQQLLDH